MIVPIIKHSSAMLRKNSVKDTGEGIVEDILRPQKIRAKYFDKGLSFIGKKLDYLIAPIFQDEYNYLNGALFIDKLNPSKRKLKNGKLNKIKNQLKIYCYEKVL